MDSAGDWQRRRERNMADDLEACVRYRFSIQITCKSCDRTLVIDPEPLLRLAFLRRWERFLINAGKHMRCQRCGTKWPEIKPYDGPVRDAPIGITTEQQFNELKKRLRR
jgi:hypothetical protein